MRRISVMSGGARSTVEDLGRRGVGRFGVPSGGAFDAVALVAANRLVGNAAGAAGIEVTLRGPELLNAGDEDLAVAWVGGGMAGELVETDRVVKLDEGVACRLAAGATLRFGYVRGGARAWLALSGGIDVAPVLGSRSTDVNAAFGGVAGRALRAGDELSLGCEPPGAMLVSFADPLHTIAAPVLLRLLPGPQVELLAGGVDPLLAKPWVVARDSDRGGVRLLADGDGPAAPLRGAAGIPPEGTTLGAVQVPPDGYPIILGPDRPITGGYAKPALVIRADLGRLAALRPGDRVRFAAIELDEALRLARLRWDAAGGPP